MPHTITSLLRRGPLVVLLTSGENLRLAPGETSGTLTDTEVDANPMIQKLLLRGDIAVTERPVAHADVAHAHPPVAHAHAGVTHAHAPVAPADEVRPSRRRHEPPATERSRT
jgi:hypothetical protein